MKTFVLLISLISLLSSVTFAETESLDRRLSQAVLALMDGDEQAEQGNLPAATSLYEQALQTLRALQEEDPAFNTNIVEFRIENLEQKLARIAPAESKSASPHSSVASTQDSTHFERLYIEAKEKALSDSQRLLEVERRNLDLQMSLRERERTLTQQRDQLQENQRELARLQREKETHAQETTRELQDLRRFNNLLQDRANLMEAENAELMESLAAVRERDADRGLQIQAMRADVLAAEQALEEATITTERELEHLRERLSACAQETRDRFEQLEQAQITIETLQEQLAGVPLLEETVIELNRRLNRQTQELEVLNAEKAALHQKVSGEEDLQAVLKTNLERLTDALNELTKVRLELEEKDGKIEELLSQLNMIRQPGEEPLELPPEQIPPQEMEIFEMESE